MVIKGHALAVSIAESNSNPQKIQKDSPKEWYIMIRSSLLIRFPNFKNIHPDALARLDQ